MPDPQLGERVCLYVVPRPGAQPSPSRRSAAVHGARSGSPGSSCPSTSSLVDELAATKVGKIDKKALRADIADRLRSGASA